MKSTPLMDRFGTVQVIFHPKTPEDFALVNQMIADGSMSGPPQGTPAPPSKILDPAEAGVPLTNILMLPGDATVEAPVVWGLWQLPTVIGRDAADIVIHGTRHVLTYEQCQEIATAARACMNTRDPKLEKKLAGLNEDAQALLGTLAALDMMAYSALHPEEEPDADALAALGRIKS